MSDIVAMLYEIKKLYGRLCKEVMDKYSLSRSELDILLFLYNNPDLNTAKDIVEKRGIIKSQVSMTLESLIKKEYVCALRDDHDKRIYHIHLLEAAHPIIKDGLKIRETFNNVLFKNISNNDIDVFNYVMKSIYENAKEGK